MGLFINLLHLFPENVPLENFFTEIVAYLFRADAGLLDAWLRYFDLADPDEYSAISIATQQKYARLEGQLADSIVDMALTLSDGKITDVIFVKSKIGAKEGKDQLRRYAEQLAELPEIRNRKLIYITRDDEHPQLNTISPLVQYRHLHWFEVHRFLQQQPYNQIIQELIVFMKEANAEGKRLALDNKLTAETVLSKSPIPGNVMDRTLQGSVRRRFEEVVGPIREYSLNEQRSRLAQWGIYAGYQGLNPQEWRCWIGYRLDIAGDHLPCLEIFLQVTPAAKYRYGIIKAMRTICSRPGWKPDDLDQYTWSGIYKQLEISTDVSDPDLVGGIESQFVELINELTDIKKQYAHLPW